MKTKRMMTLAVAAICAMTTMTLATEVMARGGNGAGNRNGMHTQSQTKTAGMTSVRPAGSQRRDGTFLSSGTTANGSTTRPANGKGSQDGSCRTTTTPPAATGAPQ